MPHADFVHLRVHSAYSLSEGAIRMGDLVGLCKEYQMPAVAVTDTNNLFGALEFSSAVAKEGIQPIIGCQVSLTHEAGSGGPGQGARTCRAALLPPLPLTQAIDALCGVL